MTAGRVAVFVSYSHRDDAWLRRLQVHLRPLVRGGGLDLWDDTRIAPGQRWREEIAGAIERAAVAILLISADFLASDFVFDEELPPLLRKAEEEGALILPIIVTPCRLRDGDELAAFQAVNSPDRPLSLLETPQAESILVRVADRVAEVLEGQMQEAAAAALAEVQAKPAVMADSETLFEELRVGRLALALLGALAEVAGEGSAAPAPTFSDLCRALGVRSRKSGHGALMRLVEGGWVEQARRQQRTELSITAEGLRQWQRLGAAADEDFTAMS